MTTPLYSWLNRRSAALFCHFTSLPSPLGIGNFGKAAYDFVDFLVEAGYQQWQVCPLGHNGYGDSPYQSFSAFAGNPYLIDLFPLVEAGLLDREDLVPLQELSHDGVEYGRLYERFWPVLAKASARFFEEKRDRIQGGLPLAAFLEAESSWLPAYARFMALKDHHGGRPWQEWPREHRTAASSFKAKVPKSVEDSARDYAFYQYLFFHQLKLVRDYAREKGVELIGDIPIFVAGDGADVWAHPELFELHANGTAKAVAGVPPDYFSADGQLWGNPLYDWKAHRAEGYRWWIERIRANLRTADILRIDHFRAFSSYWSVPAGAKTARQGEWLPGPGLEFFKVIRDAMPDLRLIAEDLGEIDDGVRDLLEATGLPGMAVLHFAFDPSSESGFLPHNHKQNLIVYSGTHDNDTSIGWYRQAPGPVRDFVRRYLGISGESIGWDLLRSAYRSPARIAVVPLQDLFSLDSNARMNTPGKAAGNWSWRFQTWQLENLRRESAPYLKETAQLYGRL